MKRKIRSMESMVLKLSLLVLSLCVTCVTGDTGTRNTPPEMKVEFTETYLSKNSKETFKCIATGHPPPKYEWKRDGKTVTNSTFVKVNENTGEIIFEGTQNPDYTNYQCFAKNSVGSTFSSILELKEAYIQKFSNLDKVDLGEVNQYSYQQIRCDHKGPCQPTQDCTFEWKKGAGTATSIKESNKIAVDKEGTLHFLYVEKSDQSTNENPLACGQTLESAKAFYKGGPIIMTVKLAPVKKSDPYLQYNADVTGLLGGQATLECIFSGYPVPVISWYKGKEIIDNNQIKADSKYSFESYDRKLVIKDLQEDDDRDYACGATNHAFTKGTVYLNVTSKPIFKDTAPKSLVVPRGDNATFTCNMRSLKGEDPPTAPIWYRNGVQLSANQIGPNKHYELRKDNSILIVKNVEYPGDTCSFMCAAGNYITDRSGNREFVQTYGGATLTVVEPIQVTVISETSIELNKPMPVSLAFIATTDKSLSLKYDWTFTKPDNTTLHGNNFLENVPWVVFNAEKNNLTIVPENIVEDKSEEDKVREVTGTYKVRIWHSYQEKFVKFVVYTNLKPEPVVVVQSAGFDLWIIGVILGVLVLLIVVIFIICTLYRNRGGEYLVDKKEVAAGHDPEKELKDSGFADLSRADGEKHPFDRISLSDDVKPLESDEDSMMGDYDDDTMQKFNEDGSFIGAYLDTKKGQDQSPNHQTTV